MFKTLLSKYFTWRAARSGLKLTSFAPLLQGWKGYSNNIYIQPIIVNHATCEECHCKTNNKTKRRLTSEDLRKQMRLREANNWITKHNERIRSTGTLRTSAQHRQGKQISQQEENEIPKQTKDKDTAKLKQRKSKTKLHKGFVCRTWATNYLSEDAQENEDDEFIPFFVRKYVDKSKSNFTDTEINITTSFAEKNRNNSATSSNQIESGDTLSENITKELKTKEFQLQENPYFDELNNRERRIKTSTGKPQNSSSDSYEFICSCGQAITRNKETSNSSKSSGTKYLRNERSRNSKVKFSVAALPIKQFPPINPLEEMKKPNFSARKKRDVLPTRRPHTVDTALLSKGIILVNGHHNLPNFRSTSQLALNRQYCGQRVIASSIENLNKEGQIFSRGKSEQNSQGRCGRHRSLSEPQGTAKPLSKNLGENGNKSKLYRDSVECFAGNRRCVRSPSHSLNSEDNDSNTDSNDTGLGSEIEYSFDGMAKLDVYLQPRSTNLHDH